MWWKLGILALISLVAVGGVIPIRTHAMVYDLAGPPPKWSLTEMLSAMYLTNGTVTMIAIIVLMTIFIGIKIVRNSKKAP